MRHQEDQEMRMPELRQHAALGIRRLRVVDLITGDQPIANEHGTVWVGESCSSLMPNATPYMPNPKYNA